MIITDTGWREVAAVLAEALEDLLDAPSADCPEAHRAIEALAVHQQALDVEASTR